MYKPMNSGTRKLFRRLKRVRPNASGALLRQYAREADHLDELVYCAALSDQALGIDFDLLVKALK